MITGMRHTTVGEVLESDAEWKGNEIHEVYADMDFGVHGYKNIALILEHHTAGDTLTKAESGSLHTNLGATETVTLILPQDAVAGTVFRFAVMAAYELRIDPGAAGGIYINGAKQTDNMYISADDEAETVELVCDGNGDWIAIGAVGTWTVETP